jgi:hypothetical protein
MTTVLHQAVQLGHIGVVKRLLAQPSVEVDIGGDRQNTPLFSRRTMLR